MQARAVDLLPVSPKPDEALRGRAAALYLQRPSTTQRQHQHQQHQPLFAATYLDRSVTCANGLPRMPDHPCAAAGRERRCKPPSTLHTHTLYGTYLSMASIHAQRSASARVHQASREISHVHPHSPSRTHSPPGHLVCTSHPPARPPPPPTSTAPSPRSRSSSRNHPTLGPTLAARRVPHPEFSRPRARQLQGSFRRKYYCTEQPRSRPRISTPTTR